MIAEIAESQRLGAPQRWLPLPFVVRRVEVFPIIKGPEKPDRFILQYAFDYWISMIDSSRHAPGNSRLVVQIHERSAATEFVVVTPKEHSP